MVREQRMWDENQQATSVARLSKGSVLVIMTGGIGDTVIGIPFLSVLKESAPQLKISVLADPLNKEILMGRPEICDFISFPHSRSVSSLVRLIMTLRRKRFAAIVSLLPSNLKSHSVLAMFSGSITSVKHLHHFQEKDHDWQIWFTDLVQDNEDRHRVLANLELIRPLGMDISRFSPIDVQRRMRIILSPQERDRARHRYPKPSSSTVRIGFHPGCKLGWEFKQWDHRKYSELADRIIHEQCAEVIWFGGKDEMGIVESIMGRMTGKSITVAGKLLLRDTAALIGTCDLFVSNDSGLMHVATAVDVTTIGLFSSTNPRNNPVRTGPYGSQHGVVQAADLQHISVDDVHAEIVNRLKNRDERL